MLVQKTLEVSGLDQITAKINKNLINHLWGRLWWQSLILHLFIFPVLTLSYHCLSRWRSHCPSIRWACPLPLEEVLPRPLPRPLAATLPLATTPVVGSDAPCLAGVGVRTLVALVLTICEIE